MDVENYRVGWGEVGQGSFWTRWGDFGETMFLLLLINCVVKPILVVIVKMKRNNIQQKLELILIARSTSITVYNHPTFYLSDFFFN